MTTNLKIYDLPRYKIVRIFSLFMHQITSDQYLFGFLVFVDSQQPDQIHNIFIYMTKVRVICQIFFFIIEDVHQPHMTSTSSKNFLFEDDENELKICVLNSLWMRLVWSKIYYSSNPRSKLYANHARLPFN